MHLPEWNIYFLFLLSFTNIDRVISQAGFFSRRRQPTEVKIQKKTKEKKKRETQDTNKEDEEEKKNRRRREEKAEHNFHFQRWARRRRSSEGRSHGHHFLSFYFSLYAVVLFASPSPPSPPPPSPSSYPSLLYCFSPLSLEIKKKKRNIFGVHFSVVIYFLFSSSFRERHIFELELGSIRSPTGPNSSFTFWMEHLLFLSSIERIKTEPVFQRLAGK